ncbi:MAG TPA: RidA family protein [Arachidicoccus sp.]
MELNRRNSLKKMVLTAASFVGASFMAKSAVLSSGTAVKKAKQVGSVVTKDDVPLFSSVIKHGDLVYVAGIGAHFKGDIKSHTDHVLTELEKVLKGAGSSMEKVIKASVFLHDLDDYDGMNEVFKGRFGNTPPVRTTVAVGGVPGASLVEIDVIAYV